MRFSTVALLLLTSTMPALADYPQRGVAGIENGIAGMFEGTWRVDRYGDDPAKADLAVYRCDMPVFIIAVEHGVIDYFSPDMRPEDQLELDLTTLMDSTVWLSRVGGANYQSIWLSADAFHLHQVSEEGETDWETPFLFTRCP